MCTYMLFIQPLLIRLELKTSEGLQTSAYIESLLEQVFLPLFEVMSIVSVEEQGILLVWHINLVCSGYKKAITGNATTYRYVCTYVYSIV